MWAGLLQGFANHLCLCYYKYGLHSGFLYCGNHSRYFPMLHGYIQIRRVYAFCTFSSDQRDVGSYRLTADFKADSIINWVWPAWFLWGSFSISLPGSCFLAYWKSLLYFKSRCDHSNLVFYAGALSLAQVWPVSLQFLPASFITVITGSVLALAINTWLPVISILSQPIHLVPKGIFAQIKFPDYAILFHQNDLNVLIWKNAVIIPLWSLRSRLYCP